MPWYTMLESNMTQVDVNYKKASRNEKPIDPSLVDYKFSNFELMHGILCRLNSKYTPDEVAYLTEKLGHPPTMLNQDRKNGLIITSKMIKRYLKNWRDDKVNTPLVLNVEEYQDLIDKCDQLITEGHQDEPTPIIQNNKLEPTGKGENMESYTIITLDENTSLPTLTGGCIGPNNDLVACPVLLDSGSSVCLSSFEFIQKLGFTESDLTNSDKFLIRTASGSVKAMGTIKIELFLKAKNAEFFSFNVEFLICNTKLNKLILGINFLRACEFSWSSYRNHEDVTLKCKSRGNITVRRIFRTLNSTTPTKFTNSGQINVHAMEMKSIKLNALNFHPQGNAQYYPVNQNIYLPTHSDGIVKQSELEYILIGEANNVESRTDSENIPQQKVWPIASKCIFTTTLLFKEKRSFTDKSLEINMIDVNSDTNEVIEDINSVDISHSGTDPLDKYVFDTISPFPGHLGDAQAYFENEVVNKTPDVSHLDPKWEQKYKNLFKEYNKCLSSSKTDVGKAKIEPIKFELPKKPVFDKVRVHSELEYEVISEAIDLLLKAGTIEPGEQNSPYNSNIFLVSTGSETEKKFSSAIADKMSRQEQLEALRKSSRMVIDFRAINNTIPDGHWGSPILPRLSNILPKFSNRFISKIDVRSGFHSCPLDKTVRNITTFRLQDGRCFRYKRLAMGMKFSPIVFQTILSKVINKESFEQFKLKHTELKGANFEDSFILYLDDLALCSIRDMKVHFLLWKYCLERFDLYGLKLNTGKCSVLQKNATEYLGVMLDFENNLFMLSEDRAQAFANWNMPLTRASILSRLATLNYFSNLLPGLKMLMTCLMQLCKDTGEYKPLKLHIKEFKMIQLIVCMRIRLTLPNMMASMLISTDSSHVAYAGCLHQYLKPSQTSDRFRDFKESIVDNKNISNRKDKKLEPTETNNKLHCNHRPICETFPCKYYYKEKVDTIKSIYPENSNKMYPFNDDKISQETIKSTAPEHFERTDDSPILTLCGVFSKTFPKESLLAPICAKELYCLVATLKYFSPWIKNSVLPAFLFADVSYVQHLVRLRSTSSKLYAISIFLSTFSNLYLVWSPSRMANNLADLFSKIDVGFFIDGDHGVPREILEPKVAPQLDEKVIITPENLHKLVLSSVPPQFSETPHRRAIKYHELPTPEELERLLNSPTPEEQLFALMWHGSQRLDASHNLFVQKDNPNKLIPKSEFEKLEKTLKLNEIRTVLAKIEHHSNHITAFTDITSQTKQFTNELLKYLVENKMENLEPTLFDLTKLYCRSSTVNLMDFQRVLNAFYASSLVNNNIKFNPKNQLFFLITQGANSDVKLNSVDRVLTISTTSAYLIEPKAPLVLTLEIGIKSKHVSEIYINLPSDILFHVSTTFNSTQTIYAKLYIINESENDYHIQLDQNIGRIMVHIEDQCCDSVTDLIFVHQVLDSVNNDTDPNIFITNIFQTILQHPHRQRISDPGTPALVAFDSYTNTILPNVDYEKQLINRFLLLAHMLNNNNVLPKSFLIQLQESDKELLAIRELIRKNITSKYRLVNNVMVKDDNGKVKLLLDKSTLSCLADQTHNLNYHLAPNILFNYLNNHFFHPNMKIIIRDSCNACASCNFNLKSHKTKYVNQPKESDPLLINQTITIDNCQNLPFTHNNRFKNLFIAVENCTGFIIAIPTKSTTTEEMIDSLLTVFTILNVPSEIRSDMASPFASYSFASFLSEYGCKHSHSVPQRSNSCGVVERSIYLFRQLLTSMVLHSPPSERLNWNRLCKKATVIFNNSIPYSKVNTLSRFNLIHSNFKMQPPHLLTSFPEIEPEQLLEQQRKSLLSINRERIRAQSKYRNKSNPFRVGNLVQLVKSKNELPSINAGTGLQATSNNLYRVREIGPSHCRINGLMNDENVTVDFNRLKHATPMQLFPNLGSIPFELGEFHRNVYRSGGDKSMLELLIDDSKKKKKSITELIQNQDYKLVQPGDEELNDETTDTTNNEIENKNIDDEDIRYNLRSRKVYYNQNGLKPKTIGFKPFTEVVEFRKNDEPSKLNRQTILEKVKYVKEEYIFQIFLNVIPQYDISSKELIELQSKYIRSKYLNK